MAPDSDPHRLLHRPDLVLRRSWLKCVCNPCRINQISLELVLRGPKQDYAQKPNEICTFDSELVLRDVPGKLVQWRRQPQWFRRSILLTAFVDSPRDEVIRVPVPPTLLRLDSPGSLASFISTGALTRSDSRIGTEPTAANTTRFFSDFRHGDSSSPRPI